MSMGLIRIALGHVPTDVPEVYEVVLDCIGPDDVLDVPAWLATDGGDDVTHVGVRMEWVLQGRDTHAPGMSDTGMRPTQYPHGRYLATLA